MLKSKLKVFLLKKKISERLAKCLLIITCLTIASLIPSGSVISSMATTFSSKVSMMEHNALEFIECVIGVDLKSYDDITYTYQDFEQSTRYPGHLFSVVGINLTNTKGWVGVGLTFVDGRLVEYSGPSYKHRNNLVLKGDLGSNPVEIAESLLERYQEYFDASYCSKLITLLDKVDTSSEESVVEGAGSILHLHISENWLGQRSFTFVWHYKEGNLEAPKKRILLSISEDGSINLFVDEWGIYRIGSANVKLSKEDAVKIALRLTREYVEKLDSPSPNIICNVTARLLLYNDYPNPRGGDILVLYPYWGIIIDFDKSYREKSGVYWICGYYVGIWADTGEVFYASPQGYYGLPPQGTEIND